MNSYGHRRGAREQPGARQVGAAGNDALRHGAHTLAIFQGTQDSWKILFAAKTLALGLFDSINAITTAKLWVLTMMVMLSSSIVVGLVRIGTANKPFDEIERWLGVVMSFVFLADRPCPPYAMFFHKSVTKAVADGPVHRGRLEGPVITPSPSCSCTRRPPHTARVGGRATRGSDSRSVLIGGDGTTVATQCGHHRPHCPRLGGPTPLPRRPGRSRGAGAGGRTTHLFGVGRSAAGAASSASGSSRPPRRPARGRSSVGRPGGRRCSSSVS